MNRPYGLTSGRAAFIPDYLTSYYLKPRGTVVTPDKTGKDSSSGPIFDSSDFVNPIGQMNPADFQADEELLVTAPSPAAASGQSMDSLWVVVGLLAAGAGAFYWYRNR